MSEEFTYHQINEQDAAQKEPAFLVKSRSDGSLRTANFLKDDDGNRVVRHDPEGNAYYGVEYPNGGVKKGAKMISAEEISDEKQAEYANSLAENAGRSAEAWNQTSHEQEDTEDDSGDVLLASAEEAVREFRNQSEEAVADSLRNHGQFGSYRMLLDECDVSIRRYSNGELTKEMLADQINSYLSTLQANLYQDKYRADSLQDSSMRFESVAIQSADAAREQDVPADTRRTIAAVERAANEIKSRAMVVSTYSQEALQLVTKAMNIAEELSRDNYGYEAHAAHLERTLHGESGLEAALYEKERSLRQVQAELEQIK